MLHGDPVTAFQRIVALSREAIALRDRIDEAAAAQRRHAAPAHDRIAEKLEDAAISMAHALADLNAARKAEKAARNPRRPAP